ncbi:hypothetical protein DKP84_19795 [Acinetobacter pittii]|nr:hypothetical protein DKP84_19795 [Acinetobacter pittii]
MGNNLFLNIYYFLKSIVGVNTLLFKKFGNLMLTLIINVIGNFKFNIKVENTSLSFFKKIVNFPLILVNTVQSLICLRYQVIPKVYSTAKVTS